MKNSILYSLFAVLMISLFWIGCKKNQHDIDQQNLAQQETPNTILPNNRLSEDNIIPFNIPFPEGTEIEITGSALRFDLPASHYILGIDGEGNFHNSALGDSGGVNCKCTKGSGCNPTKGKGQYGCFMGDNCDACEKKNLRIIGLDDVEFTHMMIVDSESDLLITKFDELDGKYILPSAFLASELIQNLLTEVESNMIESESEVSKTIFINTYGYILPVEVPSDVDNVSLAIGGGKKVKCTCNIAGKSCPLKKVVVAQYCDAGDCTDCSMTDARVVNDEGVEKQMSVTREGLINILD
ncbi:MAG: hypothetical protein AAGG75_11465 [Bacteroidota bacterium]